MEQAQNIVYPIFWKDKQGCIDKIDNFGPLIQEIEDWAIEDNEFEQSGDVQGNRFSLQSKLETSREYILVNASTQP